MDTCQNKLIGNLIVVVGPTAVGKTDLCVRLAQHYQTAILSADSRQFYHEMSVGTAKPSATEMQGIPHYFINSHHITEEYSAGSFESDALDTLNKLFQKHKVVILTGGSGLYVQAVLEGMDPMPEIPPLLRDSLIKQEQEQGLSSLLTQLKALDPVYNEQVDQANPQRVIRALEVCLATGKPYSSFRKKQVIPRPFNMIKIGLTRDRAELYTRIDKRVDQMLVNGLLAEVEQLQPYQNHNALQTVGYKEIFDFLNGDQDWPETVRLLKRNSRRYAKRQLTWFNKDKEITWFHPDNWPEIIDFIALNII